MKHPARPQVYSILLSVLLLAACSNPKKTIPEEELAAPPSPENSAVASADSGKPDANPQYLQQAMNSGGSQARDPLAKERETVHD